jgi:hypothetical protein
MSDPKPPKAPPSPADERQKRLEAALRANLKRRKANRDKDA